MSKITSNQTSGVKGVYLLHFTSPYPNGKHPQHYIGYADDINRRVEEHRNGIGARLTQVARAVGINFLLVKMWRGEDRNFERKLKNRNNAARYCPVCKQKHKEGS